MKITPFTFESLVADEAPSENRFHSFELPKKPSITQTPENHVEIVEPNFSEADLMAAKQKAYDEGFASGKKEGVREAENNQQHMREEVQLVVQSINQHSDSVQQHYEQTIKHYESQMAALVTVCAQKVAGEALRLSPLADIQEMIENCVSGLFDAPQIIATIHPSLITELKPLVPKTFELVGDESLQIGDCNLSWQHGQAMRDTSQLWQMVEQTLNRHFAIEQVAPIATTPITADDAEMLLDEPMEMKIEDAIERAASAAMPTVDSMLDIHQDPPAPSPATQSIQGDSHE